MQEQVFQVVREAIEELNEELDYDSLRDVSSDTAVFGGDEGIDSLSLVTLIVTLEREVQRAFGQRVVLADEKAMSTRNSPYRTAGSLVEFILSRLSTNGE